jgi:[acyl-carrier-protein] S-malonyltransferase
MKFESPPAEDDTAAFVFPGQAADNFLGLDELRSEPAYRERYDTICSLLGRDPLRTTSDHTDAVRSNAESSLLTVLASSLALDHCRRTIAADVVAVAGYSVGQWTALYAAGMIDLSTLFHTVYARAKMMDRCAPPSFGGMLAIIGVREADLQRICGEATENGLVAEIANYNAPLHFSVSGTSDALDAIEPRIRSMRPKVLMRLPVAGPWHSSLLRPAAASFREYLEPMSFETPRIGVIDNVTGTWLPADQRELRNNLASHLAAPVLWRNCVEALIGTGAKMLIEVGLGNTLTKFDFFISRKVRHVALFGPNFS